MTRSAQKSELRSFADKAFRFCDALTAPSHLPSDISAINPYTDDQVKEVVRRFLGRFFNDRNERVFVLGINPGRFGSGVTGIPFTDPIALSDHCGIENCFQKRQELTSTFVYMCIAEWGGAEAFYKDFFLTAVSPIGFTRNGLNFNYYDSRDFLQYVRPFVVSMLRQQMSFGARRTAIVLGTGKNQAAFAAINSEFCLFERVLVLEHPRFILQYRRKQLHEYLRKYQETFAAALAG